MTAHEVHDMHVNSLAAYTSLDLRKRRAAILHIYVTSPLPLTDRDCLAHLGGSDMNDVRPRVSELIDDGWLEECGREKCQITGRPVRVCRPTAKARGAV